MNKNVLVITDKVDCTWLDIALKNPIKSCNFDILSIAVDGKISSHVYKEKYSQLSSFKIIDVNDYTEVAQENIRKFIPSFIYDFPRKEVKPGMSLMKLLRMPNKTNLWWFMEMAEKGALRTPFIKRMYFFELIKNVILKENYQEIWLELGDRELSKLIIANSDKLPPIKNISQNIRHSKNVKRNLFWTKLFFTFYKVQTKCFSRRLILKMIGVQKKDRIPEKTVLFLSFFPFFWMKSSKSGYFENFLKTVPRQASKLAPVRYGVWLTFNNAFSIWRQRREIKKIFSQLNMIPIESYLSLKDFGIAFLLSVKYIGKILRYRFNIQSHIKVDYDGYDITNIVLAELNLSLISSEIFNGILITRAIENMVSKNSISALVYRTEFQPHERAIEYGVGDKCMTIAIQLQAIGRNHLQFFFNQAELSQYYSNKDNQDSLPLPDKILVTGEYPFEVLKNAGFPEENIDICGPVRYPELVEYVKNSKNKSELRKKYGFKDNQHIFLIASPSVKEEMLNLMFSIVQALKETDDFIFLFKSHPIYKHDEEAVDIINEFYPNMNYSFLPDDVNLNDYLVLSDALILTATTVGIEAICLGTVPILFENNSTFCVNPLLEIKNSYLSVKDSEELREALFSVINNDERITEIKKHWPVAIKKLFYSVEEHPGATSCSLLKKYGVLDPTKQKRIRGKNDDE